MTLHPRTSRAVLALAVLCGSTLLTSPRDARADDVSPVGKGAVGGGLLGAEVVTITEGLAGARPGWAYAVGAVAGAGGGAVGGYFIERASFSNDGRVPTYMLAGGLALIIPALVITLNATRYVPEQGATEDNVPGGPAAEPGTPGGSVVAPPSSPPAAPPPQSLLDMHEGSLRMGVPLPDVRPVFTVAEQLQYGMRSESELRVPVLHVTF
ncbi:MAG: hypothetical protein ABSC94_26400 [Polyangiaceae bacterium]|jgi:hypothetical protein